MLNPKRLLEMARKWQKVAALGRRRMMLMSSSSNKLASSKSGGYSSGVLASRGHVFVYTVDGKRFMVPLKHLTSNIFRELFRMSEEEYGLPADGPITMPCDAVSMRHIISLLRSRVPADVEEAVLASIAKRRCLVSSAVPQQLALYGF
ncbi:auxin-responsive protein SAUR68-like [Typha latifolia]|uniref:auxin-responsive protein SAUR68-like n=1 Tax=Typha latifolia TaxID=4733 RepID=UPI003C30AFDE